jgi:hypothetical protein
LAVRSFNQKVSDVSMGRASTFFNTMRQVGSATGVAVLSTVLIGVGSNRASGGAGSVAPDLAAYHVAFLTAAVFALVGVVFSLTIHDSDASETIVRRRSVRRITRAPASSLGPERAAVPVPRASTL